LQIRFTFSLQLTVTESEDIFYDEKNQTMDLATGPIEADIYMYE